MYANGTIQTTTTTGTGALTLTAVGSCPPFSVKFTYNATEASADHFYYEITDQSTPPNFIESGIGYLSAANTLVRAVVLSTFVSGTLNDTTPTAVSLSAGTYNVICGYEAGSAGALCLPGISNSASMYRYLYSDHALSPQYGNTTTLTVNRLYIQPFLFNSARPVDALFWRTSSGSGNAQIGLYSCNRDGTPGRQIMGSTGNTTVSGGVQVVTTGGPVRIPPGWYYIGMVHDTANIVNASSVVLGNGPSPIGHDGVQYYPAYGTYSNGSTTLPNPCPVWTAVSAASTEMIGMGVRTSA